jgi:UDP-N-acetyl-D-mannosaminuronate dehydrogenase
MQRPSPRSFWKIPILNRGLAPVEAEDPEVAPLISRCVLEKQTLTASFAYEALSLADIVVVDVQCDYLKERLGNVREGNVEIAALEDSLKVIGAHIRPDCLVLIETTVPPGTTEYVAYPLIKKAFAHRGITDVEPLLAHSYERVMPGRDYVKSIRDFWRVCSGINAHGPCTWPSWSEIPCATWAASWPPPASPCWGPPTGRMWETPGTAALNWWSESSRKWAGT